MRWYRSCFSFIVALGGIYAIKHLWCNAYLLFLFVEYMAWFIGWNYALAYQFTASTVVVTWTQYILHLMSLISDNNVTNSLVQAPIAWNETGTKFYITGEALNLPAIAITIGITVLLLSGIRATAIVDLALVIFKIIVLLIFIFTCSIYVKNKNYQPFFPPNQGRH